MDKAEAISRAAAAAAAENCCAREKAKKGRKISIGFSFFLSLFVFVLFGGCERGWGGRRVSRLEGELLEFHCCVCFVAATGHRAEGERRKGALCVRIASKFGANFRLMKSARHSAAKAMGQLC